MPKILVVDDEQNVAKSVKRLLESNGFDVVIAEDGESALKQVRKSQDFSVIVSDQRMPHMTGSELFSQLAIEFPVAKRILLTGYAELDSIREAVNRGNIFRFLLKPWDDDELLACVEEGEHYFLVSKENKRLQDELALSNQNLENKVEQKTRVLNMNVRSLERYEKIVEQLPVAVTCVSDDGMIVLSNLNFMKLFDINSAIEGMAFRKVIPVDLHPAIENFRNGATYDVNLNNSRIRMTTVALEIERSIFGKLLSFQILDEN